ncbi:ABC-type glycerol-3-phosphate transport system substrate-binding protein [Paenibacillus endophyticus]|uniref:ABC-type glycerol-3-phosphate transport system substrate-binding protein n=1 Tax=Paenibacillus endophyticus TaxID=1294268 RepID=A0A7W5C4D8_9BACL|nr:extracellular solute-binding protein [Paenibacillus endophyticus]MBB3150449.1 ABC-type glycerol-3-phosphate transport system substrate-binding protein [Paenibacillus endophyticus]
MNFRKKNYAIAILIIGVLVTSIWSFYPSASSDMRNASALADFNVVTSSVGEGDYSSYLKSHSTEERPDATIRIEGEDFSGTTGDGFEISDRLQGLDGKAVRTPESGSISWDVPIKQSGLYNVRIHYLPIEGKSSAIERQFSINQQIPFKGAEIIIFNRVWGNRFEEVERDDRDNDLRPRQVEKPTWQITAITDRNGYYDEPYSFYFESGQQSISLTALREPMAIDYIELYQNSELLKYEDLKQRYEGAGIKPVDNQYIEIQAEDAIYKSSPTLYPLTDRSSPTVIPYHVSKIRINTIGGMNWKLPGQWMEWEFEVLEDGLYQIALKQKQDQLRGVYATRSLMIDGEVPFQEMKRLRFDYHLDWQMNVLGGAEPFLFHLTKGTHRIRMMVSLGDIAPLIQTIESSVLQLNELYRKILMITSNTPDSFRDYQLEKRIPEMIGTFKKQAEIIKSVADYLEQSTGERSDKVAVLHTMVSQLEEMVNNPETVPNRLKAYKVNVGGLGTWILTVREQPLSLDSLIISSPGSKLPKAEATLLQDVNHELGAYLASYTEDYDSIGDTEGEQERKITVWITTGRDQAQVLKSLVDDSFTLESNISVDLRLVPGNILLPATLAGEGPDVAMQIGEDVPVNYAMRDAAADLTKFGDFNDIASRFHDSGLVPYKYDKGVFALPEQQSFPMLFYRKDILEELGLTPPKTWQDIYNMISVLQKHNMEFYLPIEATNASLVPNATYAMLLYQNKGEFYKDSDTKSALDSEISMDVFKKWTQFYTNYKFPLLADFPNRFRTGEMPIGIVDYTTYNMLTVMAPEIKGLWDFTVVPGTEKEDGTINHEVASHTTAVMMLENADDKDAAWAFMKWWTSKETQIAYGREMEGLMGEAARYPTANVEALKELPWPVKDYKNLESQWEWVRGIPQVPGGYFTGRHLDNAFRKVVNANENAREALNDYVLYINDEIEIKRKEFNLPQ